RVLLLDRDRGADPLDRVHVRLLHPLEELLGVRRERLDVAALALGVDRVEGEGGLAGAARAGQHDQRAPRQLEVDPLQVVLPRVADGNAVLHTRRRFARECANPEMVWYPRAGWRVGPRPAGAEPYAAGCAYAAIAATAASTSASVL